MGLKFIFDGFRNDVGCERCGESADGVDGPAGAEADGSAASQSRTQATEQGKAASAGERPH